MRHPHSHRRVLFILKRRSYLYGNGYDITSSGLFHSSFFCEQELRRAGIPAEIKVVIDNNDIDREVTRFHPTDVIIEALWVVPSKFVVLNRLHPGIRWIVRLHSELPFLAQEGIAMSWILQYVQLPQVYVAGNSVRLDRDLRQLARRVGGQDRILFLPNCYTDFPDHKPKHLEDRPLDIGCFGAIRPLKNQLVQAVAAVEFFPHTGRHRLRFHINAGRVEWQGESVLQNLRGLFEQLGPRYTLVEYPWLPRHEFLQVLQLMDLGMQVSLSETFNIAAADMVARSIPVVVSPEIPWVSPLFQAAPTDVAAVVKALRWAWGAGSVGAFLNRMRLRRFAEESADQWRQVFA